MNAATHYCPVSGRPVGRRRIAGQNVADVLCPEYDRESGYCRLALELPRIRQWRRLAEALDEIDGGEGVHCVMQ